MTRGGKKAQQGVASARALFGGARISMLLRTLSATVATAHTFAEIEREII